MISNKTDRRLYKTILKTFISIIKIANDLDRSTR